MKSFQIRIACTLLFLNFLATILAGCSESNTSKIKVVTSTSLLSYIAQQVGGDKVEVINLVPATQHPGDFSVKPSDIEKLAGANLFLLLGVPGEAWADKLISSANNPTLTVFNANIMSANLTPFLQQAATDKVLSALSQVDNKNISMYQKSASDYKQRIAAKEANLQSKLVKAKASQINAIASVMQADFLKWAGINVIATYPDPKSLTPQVVKELVDQGKAAKANLVVDNIHNGKDAGKALAEELGAKQINLSNFPGGTGNTETWEKAIDRNVDLILEAITGQ
jgi:zinc transport system substrate-binding protein